MDVVFNTRSDLRKGSARINIYNKYLEFDKMADVNAEFRDYDNYDQYDYALLYGGENEVLRARKQNPDIVIGLSKLSEQTKERIRELREADFLIADSASQRDYYLKHNTSIVTVPLVETAPEIYKRHTEGGELVLAYHGNKAHLQSFAPELTNALERIDELYDIRLIAVYDIKSHGAWEEGRPDIEIEDVQHSKTRDWDPIHRKLIDADIGLVPAGASLPYHVRKPLLDATSEYFAESTEQDYLLRFKSNTNAGRAFVFMQLGIPVIASPVSELRFVIDDGKTGYTSLTEEGWIDAISRLRSSVELRETIAKNAYQLLSDRYTTEHAAEVLRQYMSEYRRGNTHAFEVPNTRGEEVYRNAPTERMRLAHELVTSIREEGYYSTGKKLLGYVQKTR
jgi:glycosyltransferase involved in cell wall biosynthesis